MLMIVYISAKFSEPVLYGMLMIVYISAQFSEPVLYAPCFLRGGREVSSDNGLTRCYSVGDVPQILPETNLTLSPASSPPSPAPPRQPPAAPGESSEDVAHCLRYLPSRFSGSSETTLNSPLEGIQQTTKSTHACSIPPPLPPRKGITVLVISFHQKCIFQK